MAPIRGSLPGALWAGARAGKTAIEVAYVQAGALGLEPPLAASPNSMPRRIDGMPAGTDADQNVRELHWIAR